MTGILESLHTEAPARLIVEPFPVPATAVRRRVVGLDLWLDVRHRGSAELGDGLVAALLRTAVRLTHLEDIDGRPLWPVAGHAEATRVRARVVARDDDVHLTDSALLEVLAAVSTVSDWSLTRKLEEHDGVAAFAPLGSPWTAPPVEETT